MGWSYECWTARLPGPYDFFIGVFYGENLVPTRHSQETFGVGRPQRLNVASPLPQFRGSGFAYRTRTVGPWRHARAMRWLVGCGAAPLGEVLGLTRARVFRVLKPET